MLNTFITLKDTVNGAMADAFRKDAFGEYLSGAVTFTMGRDSYTLFFHKGAVVEVVAGPPLTGIDFGVAGPVEGWTELFTHRNFSRAIAPKHGRLGLQGNLVRAMGNLNALGFLAGILCEAVAAGGKA